ncbi:MAG: glycosyltransferase family 4 protein [Tenuifilum sp.]|uniref:glycosyltransferase family 4 protein n=1 Tax=Tenuifilum sp. TaxID=2760880 RepID=UPI001B4806EA|nr:glycosyltransferase family 4 protein [Bacteroidales bacterium]
MSNILFIVQLPPPVHGASLMNKLVMGRASQLPNNKCFTISLNFSKSLSDLQRFKPRKILRAITVVFEIIGKIIKYKPDIVYFSMVPIGLVLIRDSFYLMLCKALSPKSKKIIHLHRPGMLQFYSQKPYLYRFYSFIFKNCEIVHLTPRLARLELSPLNLKKTKITVIPNSIIKTPEYERHEKDWSNILFLSNFLIHKGHYELVEAFAILSSKYPQLKLTLAGAFPSETEEQNLLERINQYGLNRTVEVVGPVYGPKRFELYSRAGIFVLPSKLEYFPLVILEAMSERCAVITSGKENLQDTFVDGKQLLFLESVDPYDISQKIERLIQSPQLTQSIANEGYKRFTEIQEESLLKIDKLFTCQ